MLRSPERMPASTWATSMFNFLAAMAQAIVEVTSPTTKHKLLGDSSNNAS